MLLACAAPAPRPAALPPPSTPALTLATLTEGATQDGFVAKALYLDDDGRPRGARFVHRSGFVFDYLAIETAPQAYLWVTTYPDSDGGEPHTQEHLLLGKGDKGRYLGNYSHVRMVTSSAATWPYRTGYHFNTALGVDDFWGILAAHLDALLHPDYSDEEIRREVRNFGVAKRADGKLALEEKGTVYGEMVGAYESPDSYQEGALTRLIYGAAHPLAFDSGGSPAGIRTLTPERIRRFHAAHYQLGNMGMVAAFPARLALSTVLAEVSAQLTRFAPTSPPPLPMTADDLPSPQGAPTGTLQVVDYPHAAADQPEGVRLAWPATRHLSLADRIALELFIEAFADGEGSTLYRAIIDTNTRRIDVGATRLFQQVRPEQGQPVVIDIEGLSPAHSDEASLRALRDVVMGELGRIAALPDGAPELAELGRRIAARAVDAQSVQDKNLDTPPQFGSRNDGDRTGDWWVRELGDVAGEPGFKKSLSSRRAYARAVAQAAQTHNPWREQLRAWGLLVTPYGTISHASPALRKTLDDERDARAAAELVRLQAQYAVPDGDQALGRRAAEIATWDAQMARTEAAVPMPSFATHPPLSGDDDLQFVETDVHGVPAVVSTFETMKSATVGIALRVDGVAEADLPYLSLVPALLHGGAIGVVRDGHPISYEEMGERLRNEVLAVESGFDIDYASGRVELTLHGTGNDAAETARAVGWLRTLLTGVDLRPENLPRIRDVVGQEASWLRQVMKEPEEEWLDTLVESYRRQTRPQILHAGLFLTRAYDAFAVSWLLDGGDGDAGKFFARLARLGGIDRPTVERLTAALGGVDGAPVAARTPMSRAITELVGAARKLALPARKKIARAGRELSDLLVQVPDTSLASDWAALCNQLARWQARDPGQALQAFDRVFRALRHTDEARLWMVGSSPTERALAPDVAQLVAVLDGAPSTKVSAPPVPAIVVRARERGARVDDINLVALINPNTANAAFSSSGVGANYDTTDDDALVDFLAAGVLGGGGSHSLYKVVWGAGLSYGGGIGVDARAGRIVAGFSRSPDLAQLLDVVATATRHTSADPRYVDYAVANAFGSRAAETYEARAEDMASLLADGLTRERVRAFRTRLLGQRARAGLVERLHARLVAVDGAVLPLLTSASPPAGALWLAVAPEAQIAAYEKALRAAGGAESVLRIFPRDFWLANHL